MFDFEQIALARDDAAEHEDYAECERLAALRDRLIKENPDAWTAHCVTMINKPETRRLEPHVPNPVTLAPPKHQPIASEWQPKDRRTWQMMN